MSMLKPWTRCIPLCDESQTRGFSCGDDLVDLWFREHAWQAQRAGQCSTHVCLDDLGRVVAFYSFKHVTARATDMPSKSVARGFDRDGNGAVLLLCWMGLSNDLRGHGYGKLLLREVAQMARAAYVIAPFQLLVLDSVPGMEGFYEHFGFVKALAPEHRYVMRMNRLIKILESMEHDTMILE